MDLLNKLFPKPEDLWWLLVIVVIIFFLIREFWCWYFKTNEILDKKSDFNALNFRVGTVDLKIDELQSRLRSIEYSIEKINMALENKNNSPTYVQGSIDPIVSWEKSKSD
jgi:hypothetical protein